MAFGTKYQCEFTDILGIDWKVEIQEDPDPGSIITLQASGNPLTIEWYGEDDVFDQNIMGSRMSLNIEAGSDFYMSTLFTSDILKYKVIVTQGSTPFWYGYILANDYQEPYDQAPFTVTISATDGLGLLKEFKFEDLSYTTRQITSVVIHDMLDLVDIDTFTEYVNVHESTMDSGVGDSTFDQSGIDPDLFHDSTCYDAFDAILKSFNAGIKQDQGAFIIYRFKELADTTMYGRTYTDGTTKSATTKTPAQYTDRTAQASNFWDHEGGTLTMIPQVKTLNCNQDYGFRKSILKDYNFEWIKWDGTDFESWTRSTGLTVKLAAYVNKGSDTGVFMYDQDDLEDNISQGVTGMKTSTDPFVIQIKSGGYSSTGQAAIIYADVYLDVDGGSASWYYYKEGAWEGPTATFGNIEKISLTTDTYGSAGITYDEGIYTVTGIPDDGDLYIRLYVASDVNVNAAFEHAKLYFTPSEGTAIEGVGYVVANTYGRIIDKEFILGDGYGFTHDYLQYMGAYNVWDSTDPVSTSKSWHTRGATENVPLIQLISEELGGQYSRPKQLIDLPLREMHDDEFLSLTGNIQDVLNQTGGNNRKFAISNGTFNVKDREWELVLTELI